MSVGSKIRGWNNVESDDSLFSDYLTQFTHTAVPFFLFFIFISSGSVLKCHQKCHVMFKFMILPFYIYIFFLALIVHTASVYFY